MKDARRKAEQMELYLEVMIRTYNDIMAFYGEDPTDDNARRDFFSKLAFFIAEWKKSREKNIQLEETRKRNEASMKRKQHAQLKVAQSAEGAPVSPTSAGAMDSLLEKLRAAAPQTRDQRDRRRRARLKDRHQVRIASGQQIPDLNEVSEAEVGAQQATKGAGSGATEDEGTLLSPDPTLSPMKEVEEGEEDDVAKRAALLLQGMREDGAGDPEDAEKRESLRKSRRQTADEERRMRRRRREKAHTTGNNVDGANGEAAGNVSDVPPTPSTEEVAEAGSEMQVDSKAQ